MSSIPNVPGGKPRLPDGVRIYAVADIHGCSQLLDNALSRIEADLSENPTKQALRIFLGDYIDRGPDSRGVIERLIAYGHANSVVFLKGNHESCLLDFLDDPGLLDDWQRFGAMETLKSYQIPVHGRFNSRKDLSAALKQALPQSHREFLKSLKTSFMCGDYFFAHAGVRPGIPLAEQRERDLLWIREDFLFHEGSFGKLVVHGHTPVLQPELRANRINIDTGAFATGRLTCLCLEDDRMRFV